MSSVSRDRCSAVIDPDFDPGEPWLMGLLVGIATVVLAVELLLRVAGAVFPCTATNLWVMSSLERFLG